MARFKKLEEHILPGGLMVVYNAQEGERSHLDWKNIAEDRETIDAFIQRDPGYALRVYELRKDGEALKPLSLVTQRTNP